MIEIERRGQGHLVLEAIRGNFKDIRAISRSHPDISGFTVPGRTA